MFIIGMPYCTDTNANCALSSEDASPLQRLYLPYQLSSLQIEAVRQINDRWQCRVSLASLQQPDKGAVVAGFVGQFFLGEVGGFSQGPKHLTESLCGGIVFGLV
jgi:hypothetical protein